MNFALPDTALVAEARSIIAAAAPAPIVSHSVRTFLLGRAYGQKQQLAFDEEGLALAALFHDLGLCAGHRDARVPFPRVGARSLQRFLDERGVAPLRAAPLIEAIDFHMQLVPRFSRGAVVGLLQVGAWMDVTGRRGRAIAAEARAIREANPPPPTGLSFWTMVLPPALNPLGCVGLLFPALFR